MSQIIQSFTDNANTYDRIKRYQQTPTLLIIQTLAQAFVTEDSYTIYGVVLKLFQRADITADTITVSIRATTGGLPTGGDLATATVDVKNLTIVTAGEWKTIVFDTPYVLSATTKYAIVVRNPTNIYGSVYWRGRIDDTPVYADEASIRYGAGAWRNYGSYPFPNDFNFITLVTPVDVEKVSPQNNSTVSTGAITILDWEDPGSGATKYSWTLTYEHPIFGTSIISSTVNAPTTEKDVSSSISTIYDTGARECTWKLRPFIGGEYVEDTDPWTLEIVGPPPTAVNPTPADTASSIAMAPLLQWDIDGPPGGDDYFFIYLNTDIDKMSTAAGLQVGWRKTQKLQIVSGLIANTTYYWQVHVANTQGWSESEIWSFTTRAFAPPVVSGGEDTPTGENNMLTVRRLIAAARNRIYYENI